MFIALTNTSKTSDARHPSSPPSFHFLRIRSRHFKLGRPTQQVSNSKIFKLLSMIAQFNLSAISHSLVSLSSVGKIRPDNFCKYHSGNVCEHQYTNLLSKLRQNLERCCLPMPLQLAQRRATLIRSHPASTSRWRLNNRRLERR
jgi:hypothetical protein